MSKYYDKDDISKILKRAVELEREQSRVGKSDENGLTLSELEELAREQGINPKWIQQAAAELHSAGVPTQAAPASEGGKVMLDGQEMYLERWVDVEPTQELMAYLLAELDHRFHTSDKDNWWNNLWGEHVKVRKSMRSAEWSFKQNDDTGLTIRVLLQSRRNKFRIRLSKRQELGVSWKNLHNLAWIPLPALAAISFPILWKAVGLGVFTGALWSGLLAVGYLMAMPFIMGFARNFVSKHKLELERLADELTDYAYELSDEFSGGKSGSTTESGIRDTDATTNSKSKLASKKSRGSAATASTSISDEIPIDDEVGEVQQGKLKNQLRS